MPQLLDRRGFLEQSALASLILGFPLLQKAAAKQLKEGGGASFPNGAPQVTVDKDFLAMFRQKMKQEVKPGVILVIPQDADKASRIAHGLGGQFLTGDSAILHLFVQAAWVCLPYEQARKAYPEITTETALIVLDVNQKAVKLVKEEPTLFGVLFHTLASEALHGKRGEQLAVTVKAQRADLGADLCKTIDQSITDLDASAFARRDQASKQLTSVANRATALLAAAHKNSDSLEAQKRLEAICASQCGCPKDSKEDPLLPFGVQWADQPPPCFKCSRSSVNLQARRFLQFMVGTSK